MIKKKTLAVGTLIVAGAGYVAGILTAPKSGRETRKDVRKAALKAKSETERQLKHAHSELNHVIDEATAFVSKSKGKVADELTKAKEQAEHVRQKTRELLSAIHEGEAEDKELQKAVDEVKKATGHLKKYIAKNIQAKDK